MFFRRWVAAVLFLLLALPARASVDFTDGSLFRTAGVPAWNAGSGTFTVMLWVYAPQITGFNDFFEADDGPLLRVYVNLGSAADSPTEPYFLTKNGEWHFNKDGTSVANPAQSFDVTVDWTFLAVSFTSGGATDLYAWQKGVNNDRLVHIAAQSDFSTIGGSGATNTFMLGNESGFVEGCICFLGPLYVYDGVALSQNQVDAQRLQSAPVTRNGLIAWSTFTDDAGLAQDRSGTAGWSTHGSPRYSTLQPPVSGLEEGNGGGAPDAAMLAALLAGALIGARTRLRLRGRSNRRSASPAPRRHWRR